MKKTYIISMLAAGLIAFVSCNNDNVFVETDENGNEVITNVIVTADDFVPQTRTTISNELTFKWADNDKIGVFPETDPEDPVPPSQVQFIASAGGAGTATFNGSGWGLMPNRKYYAYYPYVATAADSVVRFTYKSSVTQIGNDSTTHLGANDLMYTSGTAPAGSNTAQFQFHHLSSIIKVIITVPEGSTSKTFKKVILKCDDPVFPETVRFKPTDDNLDYRVETSVDAVSVSLGSNSAGFTPDNGKLSVWFMIGETDLTGKTITVTTSDGQNSLSGKIDGAKQEKGKAHLYTVSVQQSNPENTVDLGLPSGKYWAFSNLTMSGLGATETELGDYYSWGELEPYYTAKNVQVSGSTGSKTAKLNATWKDGYSDGYVQANYNKGNVIAGTYTSAVQLQKEDDAAYRKLGGNWRMPSIADVDELFEYCTFTSKTIDGVEGSLGTSKINGNTIFFPVNGYVDGKTSVGGYVSGTPGARFWLTDCVNANTARQLLIHKSGNTKDYNNAKDKWRGTPIRPIYIPSN